MIFHASQLNFPNPHPVFHISQKLGDKKPAEIRDYLLEKKFPENVVDSLLPKKKGILGFFK